MTVAILLAILGIAGFFAVVTVLRNTYVCSPSEVLIFSGRRWPLPGVSGKREVGFRVVRGGRAMRMPLIETVDRMQLTNMAIELEVTNAFSKGGVPLNVQAVANIKIPSEEPLLHNALERFMGLDKNRIVLVAKDTLEGNLRGVIAELTPEEINQKKVVFQQKLIEEADRDMHRLGLLLDNLQIQNISDDVGYLTSVGRVRGAQVRKNAKIGEVKARASALVQKAQNRQASELSKLETDTQIAQKEAERRINESSTTREALVAEARGQVQAQVAEASAQLAAWDARIERVRRQLEADVIAPAQAYRQQQEAAAKGSAAQTLAQGRAAADALGALARQYRASGAAATDALLLQKLIPVFEQLTDTMKEIKVDRLTVIGNARDGGGALGGFGGLASGLIRGNEQVRAATGVDLLAKVAMAATASPPAQVAAPPPMPPPATPAPRAKTKS